ncbi:FAD-dependent oxidoreductase [Nocardia colli]|uniref:FAD-dependent oxidoreductase n=1 Tax=Nocardia colli TaxID=2545717 RepID=UPI0035E322A9
MTASRMGAHAEQTGVLIVGAGAVGAATAWQLARRGVTVAVLEQFAVGHHHGSSHGPSRIFRVSHGSDDYLTMATRSLSLWRDLEAETGTRLLTVTGGVHHGAQKAVDDISRALTCNQIPHEMLTPAEASHRFPGMHFAGPVLFQPDEAHIHADTAVETLTGLARGLGAEFRYNSRVTEISPADHGAVVHTADGTRWYTRVVVATCGAWMTNVVGDLIELPPLQVTEQLPAQYAPYDASAAWPVFVHRFSTNGLPEEFGGFYGLLSPGQGVKIGERRGGPVTDPDRRDPAAHPALLSRLNEYVTRWFPGLQPTPLNPSPCLYTSTETEDFILDRRGPLVIGSACSGHGFKFVPELGRILADLALGGSSHPRFALPY